MLLGTVFAILHLREWFKMIGEGWRLFYNPTGGAAQFGACFFSVTGTPFNPRHQRRDRAAFYRAGL